MVSWTDACYAPGIKRSLRPLRWYQEDQLCDPKVNAAGGLSSTATAGPDPLPPGSWQGFVGCSTARPQSPSTPTAQRGKGALAREGSGLGSWDPGMHDAARSSRCTPLRSQTSPPSLFHIACPGS